jgi:hypothetical protein
VSSFLLRIGDCGLRIVRRSLRGDRVHRSQAKADWGLRIADCELRIADWGLSAGLCERTVSAEARRRRIGNCGLRIALGEWEIDT